MRRGSSCSAASSASAATSGSDDQIGRWYASLYVHQTTVPEIAFAQDLDKQQGRHQLAVADSSSVRAGDVASAAASARTVSSPADVQSLHG